MEELLGQAGIQGGIVALLLSALLTVFFLVVRGRLVPRQQLLDLRQDKNDQIQALRNERDTWRQAATDEASARRALQDQQGELLELSRAAGRVLTALPTPQGVTASAPVVQPPTPPGP